MKRLIICMITCMMLTGCSTTVDQEVIENVDNPQTDLENTNESEDESTMTAEDEKAASDENLTDTKSSKEISKLESVDVTIETLESQYENQNEIVSHVKIQYPVIKNDTDNESIKEINNFFQESAQALYEENNTYALDNVEAMTEETLINNTVREYYSEYFVMIDIKYNENGLFSVLQNFSESYSAENKNTFSTGYVFDLNSGERLNISDIFIGTQEEAAQIIGQAFLNSDNITENLKNQYKEELMANTQYVEFYLEENNIYFFYNPNMIAPYYEGTFSTSIPLNSESIFKLELNQKD
ncbi:uncharacterized protein DUF3298 [Lachnotalea glycerini]|nr:DUF3298 and DUF4163 domain-containing protein [Lachnotalea glycerini]PXV95424.1 uncharacterized protein DUF3298 [Lachnotalea glycerini]